MKIESRLVEDVHILDCSGKLILGTATMSVRNTIRNILKSGGRKIVLNLADVNQIDTLGANELVSAYTTVANQGGDMKLLCLTKKTRDILAITRLVTAFQVYDCEKAMIASFA